MTARQRLRRATRESLTIPAFSSPVDCTPWVTGGLWPAELSPATDETATLAKYLKDDLQRILAPVRKRPPHNTFAAFGKRTPSDRPPIEIPVHLRKPEPSTNGANGSAQPGVQPVPNPPAPSPAGGPSAPPQAGAFGPTTYGGQPPQSPFDKPGS